MHQDMENGALVAHGLLTAEAIQEVLYLEADVSLNRKVLMVHPLRNTSFEARALQSPRLKALKQYGTGIRAYLMDTGIRLTHVELSGFLGQQG